MNNFFARFFDQVAIAVTSLGAVIIVMFLTISGMVAFSHTLFNEVFPASMSDWVRLIATWFLAMAWESTLLITTVNMGHVPKHVPKFMALASGAIVLFFFHAFDIQLSRIELVQRWFVGLLVTAMNYVFTELFKAKWEERKVLMKEKVRTDALQSAFNEVQSILNEKDAENARLKVALDESNAALVEIGIQINQLGDFKKKILLQLTCPHCGLVSDEFNALHAHKGGCSRNPKAKRGGKRALKAGIIEVHGEEVQTD